MNPLPVNGRIVIVDDKIEQALPLMEELGKRRLSYTYYDGKPENLPSDGVGVDVRIIFLDINLLDDASHELKQLYPIVWGTMNKLIGSDNFPYVLVCWSRNEEEYNQIRERLNADLKKRKPICSLSLKKADFFTLAGEKTSGYEEKITQLFEAISSLIRGNVPFCNILRWENHIHNATNKALKEGLASIEGVEWEQTANWVFTKWGKAFSGKNFVDLSDIEKLKSAYHTLNVFLHETMEEEVANDVDTNVCFGVDDEDRQVKLTHFNERLIFSFCQTKPKEPGRIVITSEEFSNFKESLNFSFSRNPALIPSDLLERYSSMKDPYSACYHHIRKDIRNGWDIFKLTINPPCDFAQKKVTMSRVIPGFFVEAKFKQWFKNESDALFMSPVFYYRKKKEDYFFILDFRYLTTEKTDIGESDLKLKQVVLAEILSKLSRHINRQGLLVIE